MPHYSDNDLERLATDLESDMVEPKESFKGDSPTKVREAVCAFANDLPGHGVPGIVVVGLSDDATPSGLDISDELLRSLADIKTDGNILPPPTLTVEKRSIKGAEVAVLTVFPSDSPPVRFRGRIWIRVGPRRAVATAQDARKPIFHLRAGDGSLGGHASAVQDCYNDFAQLARRVDERIQLPHHSTH